MTQPVPEDTADATRKHGAAQRMTWSEDDLEFADDDADQ